MPMQTEDGKPTIGNIILTELDLLNQMITDIYAIANTVVLELDALAEQHGVARSHEDTVKEVISYIQQSSPTYANKTEAEIRKEFGL